MAARIELYKIWISFAALAAERMSLHGWRIFCWLSGFGGLWLFDIPSSIHAWGGALAALIFFAGCVYFFIQDFRSFALPRRADILRRLESDSNLAHRPLSLLEDHAINADDSNATQSLWNQYQIRLESFVKRIHPGAPKPILAAADPRALRFLCLLFLALGFFWAGPESAQRLYAGAFPFSFSGTAESEKPIPFIQLWITPPDYTGLESVTLTGDDSGKTTQTPAGSAVKFALNSPWFKPILKIDDTALHLTSTGSGQYTGEVKLADTLNDNDNMLLSAQFWFIPLAQWSFKITPDSPPSIALKEEPFIMPDSSFRIGFEVFDDYGVQNLDSVLTLDPAIEAQPALGNTATERRAVSSPPGDSFSVAPVYDFTSHPWAGLPAVLQFSVTDFAGQSATLEPVHITLPERILKNPVAQRLVSVRKQLIWAPAADYESAIQTLETLLSTPGIFKGDALAFLAVRMASSRLRWSKPGVETGSSVAALLWDTAIRIEGESLSLAAKKLRDVQQELAKALSEGTLSEADISRLTNELRQALGEYLAQLQQKLAERQAAGDSMKGLSDFTARIDEGALMDFLEQFESLLRQGDSKRAAELLSQLERLSDMLNPGMAGQMPPDVQMMNEGINELQELIDKQQSLLEKTQTTRAPDFKGAAAEQESLRYILGQLMLDADQVLNEIPENMGFAEKDMRSSAQSLKQGRADYAIPYQESAIKNLKEAQNDLQQQLSETLQKMTGLSLNGRGMGYDPLGRPLANGNQNGAMPGQDVKIPNAPQASQAHEIQKILRERAGQHDRPEQELEYFRRLLRRF